MIFQNIPSSFHEYMLVHVLSPPISILDKIRGNTNSSLNKLWKHEMKYFAS
jgi:hypothetical protein